MLNTPWWIWIALVNAAAVIWLTVSYLDEMPTGQDAPRWFVLVFRGIAVLCCLVLGSLIVLAKVFADRRLATFRAVSTSSCPPGCASAAGEAPRAPQKVAP